MEQTNEKGGREIQIDNHSKGNISKKPALERWWSQLKLLLWKNWKVALRNKRSTIVQLLVPAFFIFILWLLEIAVASNQFFGDFYDVVRRPPENSIDSIPLCVPGPISLPGEVPCLTFVFTDGNPEPLPETLDVIRYIRENNQPIIPENQVRSFPNQEAIDEFLWENKNTTQGAYIFFFSDNSTVPRNLSYSIQVNQTDTISHGAFIRINERVLIPMQYAVERAIMKIFINPNSELDINLVNFAHPEVLTTNIIGTDGPLWFFAALMFNFVVGLGNIVYEKEQKLRAIMKLMGLYDSAYWVSWFITLSIFSTSTVFTLIITGCIFQFDFFLKNAFGLYFFLLELFALSLVTMTFLLSTIVKKARSATGAGFLVFVLGFLLQLAAAFIYSDLIGSRPLQTLLAFFSPAILQVGLSELGLATEKESFPGLSWSVVNDADALSTGSISFAGIYGWLVADFFIYLLLALYLDNVIADEYGTSRPLYYFLQPSYWTGKSRRTTEKINTRSKREIKEEIDEDVIEEENIIFQNKLPSNSKVVLNKLDKIYPGEATGCCKDFCGGCCKCCADRTNPYHAVRDLSFFIESNSLFCLLGPNGAGKTTTIHMLVGFHESSSGDADIFGYSIKENITEVQKLLGICPQFDILWNELSGEEHLYLFAGLRDVSKHQIQGEVDRLLEEVSLTEARKLRSSSYSGGMKRRLSVAIALIGDPKIVFLDEPTTGMDPVSRRGVWNIIEKAKKDRVIVLTTHSMEEADILGDKIAIMARGRLQCVGSSLHLKQKFGTGYRITIGTEESKTDKVIKFFEENVKGAKLVSAPISGYMTFTVPRDSTDELVPFFKKLEKNSEELSIKDTQLSLTTLEEVFLSIAEKAELKEINRRIAEKNELNEGSKGNGDDSDEDIEAQNSSKEKNRITYQDQFKALFIKTATLQKRDKKTLICQSLTPFFLIALLFGLDRLVEYLINADPIAEVRYPPIVQPFHILTLSIERGDFYNLENFTLRNEILDPLYETGTEIYYTKDSSVSDGYIGNYLGQIGLLGNIPLEPFNTKFLPFSQFGHLATDVYSDDPRLGNSAPPIPLFFDFKEFSTRDDLDDSLFNLWNEPPRVVGGYHFKQMDDINNQYSFNVIFNRSISFSFDVPSLLNRITAAIGRNLASPVLIDYLGVKEMPVEKSDGFKLDLVTLAGAFFYTLILHQLLPVFLSNIVAEKELRIKDMMAMMGLKMKIYWVVHYIFDFSLYFLLMMFLIIAGAIFQFRVFTINNFFSYFMLFFLWGHVLVAMSFFLSSFFNKRRTSLIVGYFIVLGVALICSVLIDNIIGNVEDVSSSTRELLSIVPSFALYRGLIYLAAEVAFQGPGYSLDTLDVDVVNIAAVYGWLIAQWFVIMGLWLYLDQVLPSEWGVKKHPLFFLGYGKHHEESPLSPKDVRLPPDVEKEMNEVFDKSKEDYSIRVLNLKKVYPSIDGNPPKIAVKGVSFGVKHGQCLGILGHNGAGKTTLIHMLIGLFESSSGTAFINGFNLDNELASIHRFMGVCPQHDILWENLTGKEHLLFYGRVKGLRGKELKKQVRKGLKDVNLYDARNKQAGKYSGGMKRRLSVAISLIGDPKVLFLDEPSTGLDPKSRQDLWEILNKAKQNSSVILTTHSMEEADSLCDRLMIMSEGEIKCIGPSGDLKSRFGEGFKLSVQVSRGKSEEPVDQFIRQTIPGVSLVDEFAGTRNYKVPKDSIPLSQVFEAMETEKKQLEITDWAITNTTLEEVFLSVSLGEHEKQPKKEDLVLKEKNDDIEMEEPRFILD